jgi:integrase
MLRAGDLIDLEDEDIDMKAMTLRIRDGKFGKSAILPIPQRCVQILEQYLQVRPKVEIGGNILCFILINIILWNLRGP